MIKINNRNSEKRCEIYSKLTLEIPEWRHWRCSGIFIVDLYFKPLSSVSVGDFEHILGEFLTRNPNLKFSSGVSRISEGRWSKSPPNWLVKTKEELLGSREYTRSGCYWCWVASLSPMFPRYRNQSFDLQ